MLLTNWDTDKSPQMGPTKDFKKTKFNVGGVHFETFTDTLSLTEGTKLSNLNNISENYDPKYNEYFFDRNPEIFNSILDFYRTGELHIPRGVCGKAFQNELEFWDIDKKKLSLCCLEQFFKYRDNVNQLEMASEENTDFKDKETAKISHWEGWRLHIWNSMEGNYDSWLSKIPVCLYVIAAFTTIIVYIMETDPDTRVPRVLPDYVINRTFTNPKIKMFLTSDTPSYLRIVEYVCLGYLLLDFIIRLFVCPSQVKFWKNLLNLTDALCLLAALVYMVLPPVFFMALNSSPLEYDWNAIGAVFYTVLCMRTVSSFRIARLLRVTMEGTVGRSIKVTAVNSWKVIILLLTMVSGASFIYSSVVYMCELQQADNFENLGEGMWWALITMTTVGYGDIYPMTICGHLVGGMCALTGIIVTALPIAVLTRSFTQQYQLVEQEIKFKKNLESLIKHESKSTKIPHTWEKAKNKQNLARNNKILNQCLKEQGLQGDCQIVEIQPTCKLNSP